MSAPQPVWIHSSQEAPALSRARLRSLTSGLLHHQFLYGSARQSQLWTDVFHRHSPVHRQADFSEIYRALFQEVAARVTTRSIHVIGLGTGTGLKDQWLLQKLQAHNPKLNIRFTPVDVSPSLALASARRLAPYCATPPRPLVCDLPEFPELPGWLDDGGMPRIYSFFGMTPNFLPEDVFPLLKKFLRPRDRLLLSANLAPGGDESPTAYAAGCRTILPQYNNPECRAWLTAVLDEWGLTPHLRTISIDIQKSGSLSGVFAHAWWKKRVTLSLDGKEITLSPRKPLRLFFSLRYTPHRLAQTLHHYGLKLGSGFMTWNDEEGVWSART